MSEEDARGAVVRTAPNASAHTCDFDILLSGFPSEGSRFSPETYCQIRQGLVLARLNYLIYDLKVDVLDEDERKGIITVRISSATPIEDVDV